MTTIQLKLGEKVAEIIAYHNTLAIVVSAALGGGDNKTPTKPGTPGVVDLAAGHGSVESAVAAINRGMRIT